MSQFGKVFVLSAVLAFGLGHSISANQFDAKKYYSFGPAQVHDVTALSSLDNTPMPLPSEGDISTGDIIGAIDAADVIFDKIVNLGKKVWALVEQGRPVYDYKLDVASALPEGLKNWQSLQGWQVPHARVYRVEYKNGYGMTVVSFSYRVVFSYGGNYQGLGRYLTQVTVQPAELNVAWGYKFKAEAKVPSVVNAGTSRDPMAGMQVDVTWNVDTVVKHSESTTSYFVRGDGLFTDLSNGN